VDIGPPKLEERIEGSTADEVWERLLSDPRSIVVDPFFLQGGGGPPAALVKPGDKIPLVDPVTGRQYEVTVIGVIANDVELAGSLMSNDAAASILGVNAAASRFFIDVAEGFTPDDVASRLQDGFIESGLEADSFVALTEEQGQQQTQFLRLMQGYLALGLLVGIAGLGVVMVRAVRERRRDVGVLRSLGFVPQQVRRAFLFESGFVSFEGILIGAILALVTASQLVANGDFGEGLVFHVPWAQVVIVCGAAAVGALVATVWPAQQASKIPPAVALRIAD
jgi:putative ABC transport system permease protein